MFENSCVRFSLLVLSSCLLHNLTESETSYSWRLDLASGGGEGRIVAEMNEKVPRPGGDEKQVSLINLYKDLKHILSRCPVREF